MVQTLAALAAVAGAIVLVRHLLRVGGLGAAIGSSRELRVLESASLGGKRHLHLVEVAGERLLVGSTESVVNLLRRLPRRPGASEPVALEPAAGDERKSPRGARPWLRLLVPMLVFGWIASSAGIAHAETAAPLVSGVGEAGRLTISLDGLTAPERISSTLEIVALLTLISVAPSILLMATCFTRILIVLALLRQAMGTASLPPNQILVGLALFVTFYVMSPVAEAVYAEAVTPYMEREIDGGTAVQLGIAPVRGYLLAHTREKDLLLFLELAKKEIPEEMEQVGLSTLLPAYLISEIRTSFEIGFMIYLPFLVIDLMIASMLISLGMIMLPPVMISLPFKLMLFVLMDGWNLTLTALVSGLV